MGKTLFVLELPEPEVRKAQAPPVKKHKSKKLYSRKLKHKGRAGEANPRQAGGFSFAQTALRGLPGHARLSGLSALRVWPGLLFRRPGYNVTIILHVLC